MPKVSNNFVSISFADDTTILFEGSNIHSIVTSLNYELDQLIIWLNANKLSISVSTTHYMVFHRARRKIDHEDIIMNNNIVQQVHCTQFKGIIIDDKLKWANHISYIKNKITKGMGILLKVSKVLKYKCYCSYTILSFFHIYLLFRGLGVLRLTFTSNHSLYSRRRKNVRIISFSRYNSLTKLLFKQL